VAKTNNLFKFGLMKKIKFNPENKETLTYGEALGPAMEIKTRSEAMGYLDAYVAFIQKDIDANKFDPDGQTAAEIARHNLGYWAGYYGNDVRRRVEKLFSCAHPIFGSIAKNGIPTSREAFEMGLQISKMGGFKQYAKSKTNDKS
jgi:hypothetical protein